MKGLTMCAPSKKKAKRKGQIANPERVSEPTPPTSPPVKWPDFAARSKEIFGDQVLDAVDDFLEYRHRDWELAMEADLKAGQEARAKRQQKA